MDGCRVDNWFHARGAKERRRKRVSVVTPIESIGFSSFSLYHLLFLLSLYFHDPLPEGHQADLDQFEMLAGEGDADDGEKEQESEN